jgi:hypothetical protein
MMTQIAGEAQGWMSHTACGFCGAVVWLVHFLQSMREMGHPAVSVNVKEAMENLYYAESIPD